MDILDHRPGEHAACCSRFAFDQRIHALDCPEILEVEIIVFDSYAKLFFQKVNELKRQKRVDESKGEDVFIVPELMTSKKAR
jgi:hypothetical protein